jgi:hypothetical protein
MLQRPSTKTSCDGIPKIKMSFGDTRFNTKSSFTSLTIVSNTTMEQSQRLGEDNFNNWLDAVLVW